MSSYWSKRRKINKLANEIGARKEKSKQPACNLSTFTSKDLGANKNVEEKDVTVGQTVMQSHTICENVLVDDNTAVPVVRSNENRELRYAGNAVSSYHLDTDNSENERDDDDDKFLHTFGVRLIFL